MRPRPLRAQHEALALGDGLLSGAVVTWCPSTVSTVSAALRSWFVRLGGGVALCLLMALGGTRSEAQSLPSQAARRPATKVSLRLDALGDATSRLSAADRRDLSARIAGRLGRRYEVSSSPRARAPSELPRAPSPVPRARLIAKVVDAGGGRCRVDLLLLAPPLLPRHGQTGPALCTALALGKGLLAALDKIIPQGGGDAEASPRRPPGPRQPRSPGPRQPRSPRSRQPAAPGGEEPTSVDGAPSTGKPASPNPGARGPATPRFRDRFQMGIGLVVAQRQIAFGGDHRHAAATGIDATVDIYPFVGLRHDRLADMGIGLRYGRLFSSAGLGPVDWLEAMLYFRFPFEAKNGASSLRGSLGWGTQRSDAGSWVALSSEAVARVHTLSAGLRGWLPFWRHRAWWLGLGAEGTVSLLLPVLQVAKTSVGVDLRVGPAFTYRGVTVDAAFLYRRLTFDDARSASRRSEGALGAILSVRYAI